jgi:hypothetical protein
MLVMDSGYELSARDDFVDRLRKQKKSSLFLR